MMATWDGSESSEDNFKDDSKYEQANMAVMVSVSP